MDLTVLLTPSPPTITPSHPTATEGRPLNLTCASVGGSPSPQIYWYRDGHNQRLDAQLTRGKNKDEPTTSVLMVNPTKEVDGATYRCTVWNRALSQRQKLEASTKVYVNCKYLTSFLPNAAPLISKYISHVFQTFHVSTLDPRTLSKWTRILLPSLNA